MLSCPVLAAPHPRPRTSSPPMRNLSASYAAALASHSGFVPCSGQTSGLSTCKRLPACSFSAPNSFLFKQFRTLSQKHPGVGYPRRPYPFTPMPTCFHASCFRPSCALQGPRITGRWTPVTLLPLCVLRVSALYFSLFRFFTFQFSIVDCQFPSPALHYWFFFWRKPHDDTG